MVVSLGSFCVQKNSEINYQKNCCNPRKVMPKIAPLEADSVSFGRKQKTENKKDYSISINYNDTPGSKCRIFNISIPGEEPFVYKEVGINDEDQPEYNSKGRILVTGGAGYIGSHCVLDLLDNGYDVVIFDNLSTGHAKTVKELQKYGNVKFVEGDLKNEKDIRGVFADYDIDSVIHFAAFSQVGESVKDPEKYYMNNLVGTLNLLNAMKDYDVDKLVFSSTAATYGAPNLKQGQAISEKRAQKPINPYGNTKLALERAMDDYGNAYGLRSVRLRYFNVAGADSQLRVGEWHDPESHLIPIVVKNVIDGKPLKIFGDDYKTPDRTCVRDYVNVEDLADAHILALEYLEKGGKTDFFNLGTKSGNSVKEIADAAEKVIGTKIERVIEARRGGDPDTLVADNAKAKKILGWNPSRTLEDSIRSAYEWERKRQSVSTKTFEA